MANRHRGEIHATFGDRSFTLCLTLGALAELEDAFGVADLPALGERFATGRLSARDLMRILGAGLRGAGNTLSDEDVAALPLAGGLGALAATVGALLAATFGGEGDRDP